MAHKKQMWKLADLAPPHPVLKKMLGDKVVYLTDYQADVIMGRVRWSGSDLKGAAKKWGLSYHKSRLSALMIVRQALPAGVTVEPTTGANGRVELTWDFIPF